MVPLPGVIILAGDPLPITHSIERGVLVLKMVGESTSDDVAASWKLAAETAASTPGTTRMLIDGSETGYTRRTLDEMEQLAYVLTTLFPGIRQCAVVMTSLTHFGYGRQFQHFLEKVKGPAAGIFKSVDEAWVWLGA